MYKLTVVYIESAPPINILLGFKLGISLLLPAPTIIPLPLVWCTLITLPKFCINTFSPLGLTFVYPLSTATYITSPVSNIDVFTFCINPVNNILPSSSGNKSCSNIPTAGILRGLEASA